MTKEVSQFLDVKENEIKPFVFEDPYNDFNQVEGFLCHRADHRYGALIITAVNEEEVEMQKIYCTPKLHYPFGDGQDGERKYNFPKFRVAELYTKLDGTAICQYSYADKNGTRYTTYKTRLTPVLRNSENFGDFKTMWDEMLVKYPEIISYYGKEFVNDGRYSLTYELYGKRNLHLILYDESLDTKLLFGVRQQDAMVFPVNMYFDRHKKVVNKIISFYDNKADLKAYYEMERQKIQDTNRVLDDGTIQGDEGSVMYVMDETNKWYMFKLKPEMVESIHWTSDSIDYNSIYTTALNALENFTGDIESDEFLEFVVKLLREEYEDFVILKNTTKINKAVEAVRDKIQMKVKIVDIVTQDGITMAHNDKQTIMRRLSLYFEKNEMRKVYQTCVELGFVQ